VNKIKEMMLAQNEISQGWSMVDIEGRRDIDKRLSLYQLPLNKSDIVLDVGCNVGFMSLALSPSVQLVHGIDTDTDLLEIADYTKDLLNIENVFFYEKNIIKLESANKFDLILSLQIHMWVKKPFEEYIDKIFSLLKPGGRLLFESHDLETVDIDIDDKVKYIQLKGAKIENSKEYAEKNTFYVKKPRGAKETIRRKFFLFRKPL